MSEGEYDSLTEEERTRIDNKRLEAKKERLRKKREQKEKEERERKERELLEEKRLEELANNDPIKSHMALNETAKPTVGNPEPLKTLEELMEERELTSDNGEFSAGDDAFAENLKKLAEQRQEKKQQLTEREEQKETFTNALKDKRTSISYSLIDRNAYSLPPPIYTCIEGGKVVINIKVDKSGYVTEADFNDKSSSTSNGCLVDNAIQYALKARFNPDSKSSQIGTITYLFQSK